MGLGDPFVLANGITILILVSISFGIAMCSFNVLLNMPYFIKKCCGDRYQSTAYSDEMPQSYNTNCVLEMDMLPKYVDIELQTAFSPMHYSLFNPVGNCEYTPNYADIHE